MKLTNEQIQAILDGAPEGATKFAEYVDCYYFKPAIPHGLKLYSPFVDKWQWVHDCSMLRNLRDLSDLREILELRQEVGRQQQRITELEAQLKERDAVMVELFNHGYRFGHNDTVEGQYTDIHRSDMTTYHDDIVSEIIDDLLPQPPKEKDHD